MGTALESRTKGDRCAKDALDSQLVNAPHGPDNIHEAIETTDLMKVDLFDGHSMGLGLRLSKAGQGGDGLPLHEVIKRRGFHNFDQIAEMAMGVGHVFDDNIDFGCGDGVASHRGLSQVKPGDSEGCEGLPKVLEVEAEVHKGSKEHVSGGAGKGIDVENFHGSSRL